MSLYARGLNISLSFGICELFFFCPNNNILFFINECLSRGRGGEGAENTWNLIG